MEWWVCGRADSAVGENTRTNQEQPRSFFSFFLFMTTLGFQSAQA